ncbi:hypothetical protein NDU88_005728 [Pleurodeles waltl]|uniref:Uncharacterized protein n=1 Tax=Pleurodeles waltl TaxID=8319 RepID=A0AAV7TV27_PLEWA|nr:hypothetical protein NDU88_005728 [Pleurodeles waltl]
MTGALQKVLWGLVLRDVWRERNPLSRSYSDYTPVAGMYSRLDYCLMSSTLAQDVVSVSYLTRYISDHSPLLFSYQTSRRAPWVPLWWMKAEALADPKFTHTVSYVLDHYFKENWNSTTTQATEWDAMKLVLREECMKTMYGVKMQLTSMVDVQEKILGVLEEGLAVVP